MRGTMVEGEVLVVSDHFIAHEFDATDDEFGKKHRADRLVVISDISTQNTIQRHYMSSTYPLDIRIQFIRERVEELTNERQ